MRRREIFIDLTALLDVILIILFVILAQARTQTARALEASEADRTETARLEQALLAAEAERDRALSAAAEERGRLEDENEALRRELLTDELVVDNSLVVTLSIGENGALRVENRGEAPLLIPYDWEDDTYAANRLRSTLTGLLGGTDRASAFIVFQYDRGRIYRTEYDMVRDILQDVKLEARRLDLPLSLLELDTTNE